MEPLVCNLQTFAELTEENAVLLLIMTLTKVFFILIPYVTWTGLSDSTWFLESLSCQFLVVYRKYRSNCKYTCQTPITRAFDFESFRQPTIDHHEL